MLNNNHRGHRESRSVRNDSISRSSSRFYRFPIPYDSLHCLIRIFNVDCIPRPFTNLVLHLATTSGLHNFSRDYLAFKLPSIIEYTHIHCFNGAAPEIIKNRSNAEGVSSGFPQPPCHATV